MRHPLVSVMRFFRLDSSGVTVLVSLCGLIVFVLGGLICAGPAWRGSRRAWLAYRAPVIWNQAVKTDAEPRSGDPILWIYSRAAALNTVVLLDGTQENLRDFPCLSVRGGVPGKPTGPVIIQAHRDTHFRGLADLEDGDTVALESRDGWIRKYVMHKSEIIAPEALETHFEGSRDSSDLVLVTCFPFAYSGPAPYRYLIWLEPK